MEKKLHDIDLPQFVIKFKDSCLLYIIPALDQSIKYLENSDSSILILLIILIFIQLFRTALLKAPAQAKLKIDTSESRQVSKEIKDIKKQLKSIQGMLVQLKQSNPQNHLSKDKNSDISRLVASCKQSWQKREQIATQIMQWQLKIIKEVTTLKKNRSSRSPSKVGSSIKTLSQSKKVVGSMINGMEHHKLQSNQKKISFKSQVKPKQEDTYSSRKQEKFVPRKIEEKVQKVRFQQKIVNNAIQQKINVEVHELKKQKERVTQTYQSLQFKSVSTPQAILVQGQKAQSTLMGPAEIEERRQNPTFPPPRINLPRPPPTGNKKQGKRFPPPITKGKNV